jgi:phthiodiolone/phenolphthiodiolone dimycocerosates ketoreductase
MPVKFGIQHGTSSSTLGLTHVADLRRSVKLIEELKVFDSCFLMDHLCMFPRRNPVPGCFTLLGHFSAITTRVKIGPLVTEPHRRHPAQIALEMATLNQVSNNRAILCLGAGEAMNLNAFHIPWNKSVTRLREAIEVIKLLWQSHPKKNRINYEGEFFRLSKAFLQLEKDWKAPPLWLGANSPKTLEMTGRLADGWIPFGCSPRSYKQKLSIIAKGGRAPRVEKAYEFYLAVSKDPDEARNIMRPIGQLMVSLRDDLLKEYKVPIPEGYVADHLISRDSTIQLEKQIQVMKEIPDEATFNTVGAGTPDDVIDLIQKFVQAGVEHFVFEIFGRYWDTLRLIAETIVPYCKENI